MIAHVLQVPVIVDDNQGGKWVNDSWEIAKYLEKTYPDQPSLFKGTSGMPFAAAAHCKFRRKLCVSSHPDALPHV